MRIMFTILALLVMTSISSVVEGFAAIGIMSVGPLLYVVDRIYLHKSPRSDYNWGKRGHKAMTITVALTMFISVGAMLFFVIEHPALIWS